MYKTVYLTESLRPSQMALQTYSTSVMLYFSEMLGSALLGHLPAKQLLLPAVSPLRNAFLIFIGNDLEETL